MNREKRTECRGVTINYIDEGEGIPMVFLHNGGGFYQIWEKQIAHFKKDYRVIAPDLPGFGESGESTMPYSLDYYFAFLDDFLQNLKLDRVILVGNCIGASLAIRYALEYPNKVIKMVLMNICPGERLFPSVFLRALLFKPKPKRVTKCLKAMFRFILSKTPARRQFPGILFGENPDRQSVLYKKYLEKFREPKQTRSRVNLLFACDSFTLKRIIGNTGTMPGAQLIWGEKNKVAGLKKEGYYHKNLCRIEKMHIIAGGGHLFMYELPHQTNSIISKYLNQ